MSNPIKIGSLNVLGFVWLIAFTVSILLQSISPLIPSIMNDFNISHSIGGLLYSIPILMIILFSFPLGMFSDRIGEEISIGIGIFLSVSSSFIQSLSPSFLFLIIFRAVFGLGFAICFLNLPKIVKENFPQNLSGTATGLYTTAIPFGAAMGIIFTKPLLLLTGGWRGVLSIWGFFGIAITLLWWSFLWVRRKNRRENPSEHLQFKYYQSRGLIGPKVSLKKPIFIAGFIFSLLNLLFYCTIGWLPTYLIEQGWDLSSSAGVTSLILFVEAPSVLFISMLSDRIGAKRAIMVICFLSLSFCSTVLAFKPSWSWFLSPIFGITLGGIFVLLLTLPVEIAKRDRVGRAAGGIISIGYIGALSGPPLAGYLRELTGNFTLGFIILSFIGLIATTLCFTFPKLQSQVI